MFVLDEVDLLFLYGYEEDLWSFVVYVFWKCQCLFMFVIVFLDVDKLKKLVFYNFVIFIFIEEVDGFGDISVVFKLV